MRLIKISGGKMHFQTNLISKSSMIIAFCTNTKNMYNIYLFKTFCTFNNNVWLCSVSAVVCQLVLLHCIQILHESHIINLNQLDKMLFSSCIDLHYKLITEDLTSKIETIEQGRSFPGCYCIRPGHFLWRQVQKVSLQCTRESENKLQAYFCISI